MFSQALQSVSEFEVHPEPKNSQDTIKDLLPKASALVDSFCDKVNADTLEMAPNLKKLVIRAGEGTDNIDKAACAAKGVKVANTPGANNNSAAEHAIALMMTVLRNTALAHNTMINGGWDRVNTQVLNLQTKKLGSLASVALVKS